MNKYELLGCPGNDDIAEGIEVIVSGISEETEFLREEQTEFGYQCLVADYLSIVHYFHLGFKPELSIQGAVSSACDLAEEFYTGQWTITKQTELRRVTKEEGNRYFNWFELYRDAIQFALLKPDKKLLSTMGNYLEPWFGTGWHYPDGLNPLYANLLVSVGSAFRQAPMVDLEKLEAEILADNDQVVKMLFAAWDAARNKDSEEFQENLLRSLLEFERGLDEELLFSRQALADFHSIVVNASAMLGMELPEFEPKVEARLVTRKSVGLV